MDDSLLDALNAHSGIVSLVGAGGKKTTMYQIASSHPGRVLLSSTSHMYPYDERYVDTILTVTDEPPAVEVLAQSRVIAIGGKTETPKRIGGIAPPLVQQCYLHGEFDIAVIKADGARARSVKSPGPHEPIIPPGTSTVIPIVSANVIGRPLNDRIAHRPERLTELLGVAIGETITAQHVGQLIAHPNGLMKGVGPATVIPLINMVDDDDTQVRAKDAAEIALALSDVADRIVLASMRDGRLVDVVKRGT